MSELRTEGKSYNEIAKYLNENKIETRYTRKIKSRLVFYYCKKYT